MANKQRYDNWVETTHIMGEMAAERLFTCVHERLDTLIAKGDVTKAEIARRVGKTPQQLSAWLACPRNMTVKSAGRLFAALESHLGFELETFEAVHAGNFSEFVPAAHFVPARAMVRVYTDSEPPALVRPQPSSVLEVR